MMNMLLILAGVLLNAFAQICLKQGMRQIGEFEFSWAGAVAGVANVATNGYVVLGLSMYVASVCIWLVVLSRVDVSFAYPMLSIGYIVAALFGFYFFGESLGPQRLIGIATIIFGVVLISQT